MESIPPKVRETIYERVAIGVPLVRAAESCGVPRRTFMRWLEFGRVDDAREPYRGFAAGIDRAIANFAVAGIQEISDHGAKDWRARAYLLDHSLPEFAEQDLAKRSGTTTVNVAVLVQERRELSERLSVVLAAFPEAEAAVLAVLGGADVVDGEAVEVAELVA